EDIAAAVDPRTLAVPHGEHAVVLRAREQVELLRAPDHRRGKVLVDAGLELDVAALQEALGPPQILVEPAERRSAITGDEAGRIQAGGDIALALHHRQPHQRLNPAQIYATALERVLVVQRDCG